MNSILAALGLTTITLAEGAAAFSHHSITLSFTAEGSASPVVGNPVTTTDAEITFDNLEPGSYTATGFSVDTNGAPMTSPVTSNVYVIPVVPVGTSASVLGTITLSLAPVAAAPAPTPVVPTPPAA
jgi:uncharacterized protein (DUF2141 family)